MKISPSEQQPENNQPSAELQEEVKQLSDIASDIALDSEIQAKVQSLLVQIKTSLREQNLSIEVQRELARLLSLISKLDYRNSKQVDILDLAISTLLENREDTTQNNINSNSRNKLSDSTSRNLVFIQEARRQIAIQSQEYPNPFNAILRGRGGAYNRLISGLGWFALIFVICPIFVAGSAFVGWNLFGGSKTVSDELNIKILLSQLENTQKQFETTSEINNAFRAKLTKVNDELKPLSDNQDKVKAQIQVLDNALEAADTDEQNDILENKVQVLENNIINEKLGNLKLLQDDIKKELEAATQKERESTKIVEENYQKNLSDKVTQMLPEQQSTSLADAQTTTINNFHKLEEQLKTLNEQQKQSIFNEDFFKSPVYIFCMAVSMGALGSAVSVIVRANKFIEQAKEGQSDLFFTGFLRPIVGMSFAIFAVALIESGIFSSIFAIAKKESRTVYLYMTIAFVVGFSERLVEDVVLKTENTLTGFSPRSDK